MKPGAPLLQPERLSGKDLFQFVGAGEQQPAARWLIQQFPLGLQAFDRKMLSFVEDQ
jgi:hypothetical protein